VESTNAATASRIALYLLSFGGCLRIFFIFF
jgi:hypothetical protein